MTHIPRGQASLRPDEPDARPLHDVVSDWAERQRPVVEDCVCGGEISATSRSHADVMVAVQRHQVEPRHLAYDEEHGIPWSGPQARAAALDAIGLR